METLTKTCRECQRNFEVEPQDSAFYDQVSPLLGGQKILIPAPTFCPECRWIRKASYRNFKNLYHRKSDLSGKQMISMFSPDKNLTVYSTEEWWSDQWDPLSFGRDFDFSRPFFEQFDELYRSVPQPNVSISQAENCAYTNFSWQARNCYLVFGNIKNEDCYYSNILWRSKNCFDMLYSYDCERCYECIDCESCYECIYSSDCVHCSDSSFLTNCRSCKNCYGCINLANKEYCILNEQYSKEDYEKKIRSFQTPEGHREFFKALTTLFLATPRRASNITSCENVSGNHLFNCRETFDSFDVQNSEHLRFCLTAANIKDCYDCIYNGAGQELSYESMASIGYHLLFCKNILSTCSDLYYSSDCGGIKNCFGCVGLHNKEEYCFFNKRYSKEDYESLVTKVVEHMKKTGEWGEFFPAKFSPFGYNESICNDYYPLDAVTAQKKSLPWHTNTNAEINHYVGAIYEAPYSIEEVTDAVTQKILKCEVTGKLYKVLPQELSFYREMKLPLPRRCPDQRHMERMQRRNPRILWSRTCAECAAPIQTSYSPERPEKVLCEPCYLKTVY